MLYEAHRRYGIPLIAGTDTHSLNEYKAECRRILIKADNPIASQYKITPVFIFQSLTLYPVRYLL